MNRSALVAGARAGSPKEMVKKLQQQRQELKKTKSQLFQEEGEKARV